MLTRKIVLRFGLDDDEIKHAEKIHTEGSAQTIA